MIARTHEQALKVAHASFEKFQKARLDFATEILDLAGKPFYVDALQSEGAIVQLKPLLRDAVRPPPTDAPARPSGLGYHHA